MTNQTTTKIRLVRCPKCLLLLPEPEIPVYKCGGCGTVLQAKNRKKDTEESGSSCDGTDVEKKRELDYIHDQKEITSPNQEANSSAEGESSPDTSNIRNQDDFQDCNGKQTGNKNLPHELPSSPELSRQTNEDTSNIRNQDDFQDCNGKQTGNKNLPHELPSSPELSRQTNEDKSNIRNQDDFQDCNGKQTGDKNLPHELPSSPELSRQTNEDLSPEAREQMEQVEHEFHSDQNMHAYETEFGDSKRSWSRGRSFSDDFYSSREFLCHETEDSSPEHQTNMAFAESNTTSDHCASQIACENCIREQHEDSNFINKISALIEDKQDKSDFSPEGAALDDGDESKFLSQDVDCSNESKFDGHSKEFPKNSSSSEFPKTSSSSQEISSSIVVVPEKPSPVVEANAEVEEYSSGHNFDRLKTENTLDKNDTGSSDADENALDESIPLDNDHSPDYQQLRASQKIIPRGFGHGNSVDTLDDLPLVNLIPELGVKNVNLSKSATRIYYGNDGSASSIDGFGDRIPGRVSKPPKRKFKHANFNNSNGLHREDGTPANEILSSNLELQDQTILRSGVNEILSSESEVLHQARKSSILPEKNHPTMKYRNHQDDLHDPRSYGHSIGSRIREEKDEHVSKLPFVPNCSLAGRRKGNPIHYAYNGLQHYSVFCSPDAPSYTEPDKLELLRMVNELKDELNRMHISNSRFPPRVIREEKYTPLFYDRQLAPVKEISADLRYSGYPGRYSQGNQRMAFSGDASDYRRHVDCACLHCHPQDWHRSVQLPSHTIFHNKVHCMAHSSTRYNGQCSASSSPRHYKNSEFSVWDRETKSDYQRHRDNAIKKLQLLERFQLTKRHLRPVAGGTPIVACYHCSKLLQLPADFLLLGRRCHKLRCNSCGKVMKFSLQSNTHLVPYIADAVAPPPSMVDDCSESIRRRNLASTSFSNDNNPHAEPFSCTDDYGMSFDRSFSTEGEPSLITAPVHIVERNSVMPSDDRKMKSALSEYQQTNANSKENLELLESSSKRSKWQMTSSEIKEVGGFPLHSLMGYRSPSAVMRN
ncbi:hypothetical protein ACH5RR_016911 [Cinchona calisaya]|uniref:Zinc-ribbon domain-containing protein n=1 Tax=Cinchona calisaya TaxID=153742 RepID=A0ABD3A004_9GENT